MANPCSRVRGSILVVWQCVASGVNTVMGDVTFAVGGVMTVRVCSYCEGWLGGCLLEDAGICVYVVGNKWHIVGEAI